LRRSGRIDPIRRCFNLYRALVGVVNAVYSIPCFNDNLGEILQMRPPEQIPLDNTCRILSEYGKRFPTFMPPGVAPPLRFSAGFATVNHE
jgi:hypothetical protein